MRYNLIEVAEKVTHILKGEDFKMRKIVKKVVALATALTMTAAMGITAFAADTYTFVGAPRLFGVDADDSDDAGWQPGAAQYLEDADGDGIYTATFTCAKDGEYEFKVLGDGDVFGWSFQMCLGNADSTWGDNQSQFKAAVKAGEYNVAMDPAKGLVCLVQNGAVCDMTVRYKSRDEDSANFTALTVAAISAEVATDSGKNYEPKDFEADLAALMEKAPTLFGSAAPVEDPTTEAPTTVADATTAAPATTAAKPVATGDVAPVAVLATLLGAVAVVAVAAKKREA